jgi:solute carrier family 25 (mitochondrial iron transporter), member 28/37
VSLIRVKSKLTYYRIKYSNISNTIKTIIKEEGYRGFVKGTFAKIVQTVPSSAVSWSVYEILKRYLLK